MRKAPARRHAAAALALLVSLALVGAELSTLAHDLTTTHAYCPEHGAVMDVELVDAAAIAHDDVAAGLSKGPRVSDDHGHEHCLATLFVRAATSAGSPVRGLLEPPYRVQPLGVASVGHPAAIPLLHLAPKSSPPRADLA